MFVFQTDTQPYLKIKNRTVPEHHPLKFHILELLSLKQWIYIVYWFTNNEPKLCCSIATVPPQIFLVKSEIRLRIWIQITCQKWYVSVIFCPTRHQDFQYPTIRRSNLRNYSATSTGNRDSKCLRTCVVMRAGKKHNTVRFRDKNRLFFETFQFLSLWFGSESLFSWFFKNKEKASTIFTLKCVHTYINIHTSCTYVHGTTESCKKKTKSLMYELQCDTSRPPSPGVRCCTQKVWELG